MEVGDRVKYSAKFLKSIACHTGPMPFARGVITKLQTLAGGSLVLATIKWDGDAVLPKRVNVKNLHLESEPEYFE